MTEDNQSSGRNALTITPSSVAVAVLWASVGGLGGFSGASALDDATQPALVAQNVQLLRDDVRLLREDVRGMTDDAFTRSDHREWVRATYTEHLEQVHERLRRLEDQ